MPEFENIVVDEIVVDMSGCSTHVKEPKPELASSNQVAHKFIPYHHPHHKN
jgi:hypothetical protein